MKKTRFCKYPYSADSLELDKMLNFKLKQHEKDTIYRDTNCWDS